MSTPLSESANWFAELAGIGLAAAVATSLIVAGLVRLAPRLGLLDRPNKRSSHTRVTPRGGGIGFVIVVAAGLLWLASDGRGGPHENLARSLLICGSAALILAAVSLRDDFKPLGAGVRLACQGALALGVVLGVGHLRFVSLPWVGAIDLGALGAPLTIVWLVGMMNVYNFMDGIDGIAGIQGLVAGAVWTLAGCIVDSWSVSVLGALLAGGSLGFLRYNWSPARIFMGDVGSAFLGFMFALLPLVALRSSNTDPAFLARLPLFALLAVWPFVGDGFFTFIRRAIKREIVWEPHRTHLYQRLTNLGWSHAQVSSLYAVWCLISAFAGWCVLTERALGAWLLGALAFSLLGGIAAMIWRWERQGISRTENRPPSVPDHGN